MIEIAFIRHGPTDWNEERRIQGHADRPLSSAGRAAVGAWRLPEELRDRDWFVSPLRRARETARLLGLEPAIVPELIEMDWGDWEGLRGPEIRERYGAEFERRTAMGLDLRPHNGESPRELRQRVHGWLAGLAAGGEAARTGSAAGSAAGSGAASGAAGAVCHQGVIRAMLSLATGWDMVAKPPVKLEWAAAQVFAVAPDGSVRLERANVMLESS